jgi:Tfp pilus assembly protein PilE
VRDHHAVYCRAFSARRKQKGSTLVELMTVIFIISMMSSVVVPNLRKMVDKAAYTAARAALRSVATALHQFYIERGYYPADVPRDTAPPGLCPTYLGAWPGRQSSIGGFKYDYEAWGMSAGGYWIGVTCLGKNNEKDGGNSETSTYVREGVQFMVKETGDDLYIEVDRNAKAGSPLGD